MKNVVFFIAYLMSQNDFNTLKPIHRDLLEPFLLDLIDSEAVERELRKKLFRHAPI